MKKIGFGIAILLLGILLELSASLAWISWILGAIGLFFAIDGFVSKEDNK